MSCCRGSKSRQYERNAWFRPLVHAATGACIAAMLPSEWLERLRESKPGAVLLSDDFVFLHFGWELCVCEKIVSLWGEYQKLSVDIRMQRSNHLQMTGLEPECVSSWVAFVATIGWAYLMFFWFVFFPSGKTFLFWYGLLYYSFRLFLVERKRVLRVRSLCLRA